MAYQGMQSSRAPMFSAYLIAVAGLAYLGLVAWVTYTAEFHPILLLVIVLGAMLLLASLLLMKRRRVAIRMYWSAVTVLACDLCVFAWFQPVVLRFKGTTGIYLCRTEEPIRYTLSSLALTGLFCVMGWWISRRRIRDLLQ